MAGRGDVCIGVRAPVVEFTPNTLIVLALIFAVYRVCPFGCIAMECGPLPLGWVSNVLAAELGMSHRLDCKHCHGLTWAA